MDLMLVEAGLPEYAISGEQIPLDIIVDAIVFGDVTISSPIIPSHATLQVYVEGDMGESFSS